MKSGGSILKMGDALVYAAGDNPEEENTDEKEKCKNRVFEQARGWDRGHRQKDGVVKLD